MRPTVDSVLDQFEVMLGWNSLADDNRRSMGDGWDVAKSFAELHFQALRAISAVAGEKPSAIDQAVLLCGTHGLNLFLGLLGLVARGQFDVAAYLMRGILDSQSLLFAVASDGRRAEKYMSDRLEASDARKQLVGYLRNNGRNEEADQLDRNFKDDASSANDLAHAGLLHANKLLENESGRVTPVVGGRSESESSEGMLMAALVHERWALTWLAAFRTNQLGETWMEDFTASGPLMQDWMASTGGNPR